MIVSDAHETTINTTTSEDINNILDSVHEVDYDRLPAPEKKLSLQETLTNQYIDRDVNGVAYTIGSQPTVDEMQK